MRARGDNWIFFNHSRQCGFDPDHEFYVAVFRAPCDTKRSKTLAGGDNPTFGFFAVVEASPDYPFDQFIDEVVQLNGARQFSAEAVNVFTFPVGRGPEIQFLPLTGNEREYGIRSIAGVPQETNTDTWHLVDGQVFLADALPTPQWIVRSWEHKGCITVDNSRLDERLVLDLSNAREPRRARLKRSDPMGCDCPLAARCDTDVI